MQKKIYGFFWIVVGLMLSLTIGSVRYIMFAQLVKVEDIKFIEYITSVIDANKLDLIIFIAGILLFLYGLFKAIFLSNKLSERDEAKFQRLLEKEREELPEDAQNFNEIKFMINPNDKYKTASAKINNLIGGIFITLIGIALSVLFVMVLLNTTGDANNELALLGICVGLAFFIPGFIKILRHLSNYTLGKDKLLIINREFISLGRVDSSFKIINEPITHITSIVDKGEYIIIYYTYNNTLNKTGLQAKTEQRTGKLRAYKESIIKGDLIELNAYFKSLNKKSIKKAVKQRINNQLGYDKIKRYGIISLVLCILAIAVAITMGKTFGNMLTNAITETTQGFDHDALLVFFMSPFISLGLILELILVIIYYILPLFGFGYAIAQMRCNKNALSIIALLFSIITIVFVTIMLLLGI